MTLWTKTSSKSCYGWRSLSFHAGENRRVAVRVITQDGNAAEAVMSLPGDR